MPIWRSAGDQGLATEILSVIPLPNSHYSDQAWYASNPYRIVGGVRFYERMEVKNAPEESFSAAVNVGCLWLAVTHASSFLRWCLKDCGVK